MHNKCAQQDHWQDVRTASRRILGDELSDMIEQTRASGKAEHHLISILHKVQGHFGYLGESQLYSVAQLAQISHAKVTGVATFYHYFRLQPRGRYIINCCLGTACYVKGGAQLADKFREELGINFGETSKNRLFTLEATRCVGTCGIAPVVMVGDDVYGPLSPNEVPTLIDKLMDEEDTRVSAVKW
ncbi:MAG: NADH-quinone oxidoreductase subunit NuoE [Myxococcota bacterium]|nr:NADH-quinone oxidoreductase subunit NuoE [Myxococcota bacterium]